MDLILEVRGPANLPMSSSSFYLCNICRAIFGNKAELNRHILTHTGGARRGGEGMYSERKVPRGSRWC
ncbi:MAG: C2H2-type zinc finger protein [Thermoproteota archaeon]|nr:C2H2-type zinc finger protein [Thermoproteota archaeon]